MGTVLWALAGDQDGNRREGMVLVLLLSPGSLTLSVFSLTYPALTFPALTFSLKSIFVLQYNDEVYPAIPEG